MDTSIDFLDFITRTMKKNEKFGLNRALVYHIESNGDSVRKFIDMYITTC